MNLSLFPSLCYSEAWSDLRKCAHKPHQPIFFKARIAFGCHKCLKEPNTGGRSNIHSKKNKTDRRSTREWHPEYRESEHQETAQRGSSIIAIRCNASTKSSAQTLKWRVGARRQCVMLVPSDNWWRKSRDPPRSTVFCLNLDSDRATAFRTWGLGSKQWWRSC